MERMHSHILRGKKGAIFLGKGFSDDKVEQETFCLDTENIRECLIWKRSFRKQREKVWEYK